MSETPKFTPGPWTVFIDDTGGQWTGWPISIAAANEEDKSIVRPGGQWPYEWDAAMSQREAIANAHLIAAAPELYAALQEIVTPVIRAAMAKYHTPDCPCNYCAAIAALAKAEGRK